MAADFDSRFDPDTHGACDRIGSALRQVWDDAEEVPLEDATQRLMLHLSVEPYDEIAQPAAVAPAPRKQRRRPILRRLLGGRMSRGRG